MIGGSMARVRAIVRHGVGVRELCMMSRAGLDRPLLYPAELSLVISRVNLLNDYVAIYRALGGGWNIQTPDWTIPSAQPVATNP